jgi:hypothetical protein
LHVAQPATRAIFEPFAGLDARDARGVRLRAGDLGAAYPTLRGLLEVTPTIHGYPIQAFRGGTVELIERNTRAIHAYLHRAPLDDRTAV